MGEILFFILLSNFSLLFLANSMFYLMIMFFLLSLMSSVIMGLKYSGWIGVILFLVFIGGMLVMMLYLGIFGNYYKFKYLFFQFFFCLVLTLPVVFLKKQLKKNMGNYSDFFINMIFFSLISSMLFLILIIISKMVGSGSSLRKFN